jgi:hypothetical protein
MDPGYLRHDFPFDTVYYFAKKNQIPVLKFGTGKLGVAASQLGVIVRNNRRIVMTEPSMRKLPLRRL